MSNKNDMMVIGDYTVDQIEAFQKGFNASFCKRTDDLFELKNSKII